MSDIADYALHPFVPWALKMFSVNNDPNLPEQYMAARVEKILDELGKYGQVERGEIIIDLLILCDAMGQAITLMNLKDIEKGLGQ